MRPYTCEQCGHRNYVTREDLDGERALMGDAAAMRLATKGLPRWRRFIGWLARHNPIRF